MEVGSVDGRRWISLSSVSSPIGAVMELVPEVEPVLRPTDMLSISSVPNNRLQPLESIADGQGAMWAATTLDGTFNQSVESIGTNSIRQEAPFEATLFTVTSTSSAIWALWTPSRRSNL